MSILIQGIDMPKRHHINGYYIDDDGRVLDISRKNVVGKALQYKEPKQKIGKWIDTGSGQECSVCHEIQYGYDTFRHYCANCGAKMEGDEDN